MEPQPHPLKYVFLFFFLSIFTTTTSAANSSCVVTKLEELPIIYSGNNLAPTITGKVNDKTVPMFLDTGSNITALTTKEAKARGLAIESSGIQNIGISGVHTLYSTSVRELSVGPAKGFDIPLAVFDDTKIPYDFALLLGADILMKSDLEIDLGAKKIRFLSASGNCNGEALAYWAQQSNSLALEKIGDNRPFVSVEVNGKKMLALIDSGSPWTTLFLPPALSIGFYTNAPNVTPAGLSRGIDGGQVKAWNAHFDLKVGGEVISNARIRVIERNAGGTIVKADLLLGQDWLRAHRIVLSPKHNRMEFTPSSLRVNEIQNEPREPWFSGDAVEGNLDAQYALAVYFASKKDTVQSKFWFNRAAEGGACWSELHYRAQPSSEWELFYRY